MGDRALIYTRVSQDRAGGRSHREQEAETRAVCEANGWEVVDVIQDSVGASRHSKGTRNGWKSVLSAIENGTCDVLVTWEASRAQRDLATFAALRENCARLGVKLNYAGTTYDMTDSDDRFVAGLHSLIGEKEVDASRERIKRAMRSNAEQGRPHGKIPYGYARRYDEKTKLLLSQDPHPEQAPIVRQIFARYLEGVGIRTIARELQAQGSTTKNGCQWQDGEVRRILGNPIYAGRRVHRGAVVGEATWEPLVDPVQFDRVQERFARSREGKTRATAQARLLTGVGRCGLCGGKVTRIHDRGKRSVYTCKLCYRVSRDMKKLDRYVTDVLLAVLRKPETRDALSAQGPDPAVKEAQAAIAALKARIEEATTQAANGVITFSALGKIESQLQRQIDEAEKGLRRALVPIDIDLPLDSLDQWWDSLEPEVRRAVVNTLIAAVVILPARMKGERTFDPETVRIEFRR